MSTTAPVRSAFIISLDFELYWGVRDHVALADYKDNLLGVQQAVPAMLKLFADYDIHATWATVGFLFCNGREELMENLPAVKPKYRDPRLSPYCDFSTLGRTESEDPYHFAPSLVRLIAAARGQEVGTHTLSHYCCLEPQQDVDAFRADIACAQKLAAQFGIILNSLVFPRNQYDAAHLQACAEVGIRAVRGTEDSWLYRSRAHSAETRVQRLLRFGDAYLNLSGEHHSLTPAPGSAPVNLPSSRFLRPVSSARVFESLRMKRITNAMTDAAENGREFHLWWHPHNFGIRLPENLDFLKRILDHFSHLRQSHGMQSLNMGEAAGVPARTAASA